MTTTQITPESQTAAEHSTAGDRPQRPAASGRPQHPDAAALRPLILDLGVPLGSYYLMRAAGVALIPALAISSILPAARTITGAIKDRKVNGLAALIVVVNVVGIAVTFWTGDPRLMLAKGAALSSTIGIALLISAFAGRPLMTAGLKPVMTRADAARTAAFDRLSATSPRFGRLELLFSATWGLVLLAECVTRVVCAFTLPVSTMVWLSTVMTLGAIGVGIIAGTPFSHAMDTMVKHEAGR
jgi:hypothetical protein